MKTTLGFTKMQATGNDFVVIDAMDGSRRPWKQLAVDLCNRHSGIGADGLLLLLPSKKADFRMRMFNPDGTEDMCGNGLRCVSRLHWEHTRKDTLNVETLSGMRTVTIHPHSHTPNHSASVWRATVQMGKPGLKSADVPAVTEKERVFDHPLTLRNRNLRITSLSVGTAHTLVFHQGSRLPANWHGISAMIETHPMFPERTSVLWIKVVNRQHLAMKIWERGVGETLACGTGACAAMVGARLHQFVDERVLIDSPGGRMEVSWDGEGEVVLTGDAEIVFKGEWIPHRTVYGTNGLDYENEDDDDDKDEPET